MEPEDIKKLLVVVLFFVVASIAFFFVFWRPMSTDLRNSQVDLSNQTAKLLQLEQDVKDWPESFSQQTMEQYEVELEQLWNLIPSEEELAMLLDEIETRAKSARLNIISLARVSASKATFEIDQPQTGQKTQYIRIPYEISLGGKYVGLIEFLRKLEDSRRLVTVTGIRIYKGRGVYPVDVEIQFNIFYSKVGVEIG